MVFAWLALTIISILIYISSRGYIASKWASLIAFSGSVGFMATVINESIRPFFYSHFPNFQWIDSVLLFIKVTGSFTTQIILPYSFLMFGVYSVEFIADELKKRIAYGALLPVIITFIVSPIYPDVKFNYLWITLWIAPYILTASTLLFVSWMKQTDPSLRLDRSFAFFTASIPLLFDLYTGFIARILGDNDAWRMNVYIIIVLFIAYLYLTIRYGMFGLKINFLKRRLDKSIQAVHDMSVIYNHTVKNELAKMDLYIKRLNIHEHAEEDLKHIQESISHIIQMSNRIQKQSKRIVIKKSKQDIAQLVEEALRMVSPYLTSKNIHISTSYACPTSIHCDSTHITEVLQNILLNAIEAMEMEGKLCIRLIETKKNLVLSIRDNGKGIAPEILPLIFNPFFSTKNSEQNFGLGLGYCFNVMKEHKGSIQLYSDGQSGTTAFLHFPKPKKSTFEKGLSD